MTEAERIADQLLRAFEGDTWAGRSIKSIVAEISAEQAARHPLAGSHSAWELVRHIGTWLKVAEIRLGGQVHDPTEEENFGRIADQSAAAWGEEWRELERRYRGLAEAVTRLSDERLDQLVVGREYSVYHLLHGVVQHSLYHAGQIAVLGRQGEESRGGAEGAEGGPALDEITGAVVDAAVRIHVELGPGLLESVYEAVLGRALEKRGFRVARQRGIRFEYDGMVFEEGFRIDLLVEDRVVVELKSVEKLAPVHGKQLLTYLRLMDLPVGLLINFGAATLKEGLRRVVNNLSASAPGEASLGHQRKAAYTSF